MLAQRSAVACLVGLLCQQAGGQESLETQSFKQERKGWLQVPQKKLYVGAGVGVWMVPSVQGKEACTAGQAA
jgi:hypothetical protein